jgi:hypothetical protein
VRSAESFLEDKQPRSAIYLMAGRMLSPQRQVDKELPPAGAARLYPPSAVEFELDPSQFSVFRLSIAIAIMRRHPHQVTELVNT